MDSGITGWDISITDTITDNASSGLVSEGTGAASLGDPIDALAWLARAARELGDSLRRSRSSSPVRAAPYSPRRRAAASAPTSARAPGNAVGRQLLVAGTAQGYLGVVRFRGNPFGLQPSTQFGDTGGIQARERLVIGEGGLLLAPRPRRPSMKSLIQADKQEADCRNQEARARWAPEFPCTLRTKCYIEVTAGRKRPLGHRRRHLQASADRRMPPLRRLAGEVVKPPLRPRRPY